MPTTLLGIDIGKYAVKAAVVQTSYRKTVVTGLAAVELARTNGDVFAAVRAAIEVAVSTQPGLAGQVTPQKPDVPDAIAVAIEGERAALRTLELPASAERQLADVLPFELEAAVPFEMDDSVFDFHVQPSSKKDAKPADGGEAAGTQMIEVLAAVAKIADVKARIDLVKMAVGTEPERVEVGALPLSNLAEYTEALRAPGPVVVVDIGAHASDVVIFENGEVRLARTVSFGTEGLPETAPKLAREIRVTLASHRAGGGARPTNVYLCGGGALHSRGADGFLAGELELPVTFLPAPAIDLADPQRVFELPAFARALGLALGLVGRAPGLNLRRGPLAYERGFGWIRERIPILAGLGAVIGVSFIFSSCVGLYATAKDLDTLHEALAIVTKDVLGEETADADRANELLAQKAGAPDEDPMPHADAFDVMVRLSEDIPQSMVHDIEELDVQKGHVIVHGIVGSIPDAQSIAGSLKDERCFSDVKITRTTQMVGTDRQKYVLEMDLKCPEDVHDKKEKKTSASASSSAAPSESGGK